MTLPKPNSRSAGASPTLTELAEVLFCSDLQPSQGPTYAQVHTAITACLGRYDGDVAACACDLARSYGNDPQTACARMRWCRQMVARAFAPFAHAA